MSNTQNSVGMQNNNFFEQLLSSQVLTKMLNDNNNDTNKNYFIKMLLFMGMDQFKKLLNGIIDHFLTKLKDFEFTKFIYELIIKFINIFKINKYFTNTLSIKHNNVVSIIDNNSLELDNLKIKNLYKTNLECVINFQLSFWNNLISDKYNELLTYDYNYVNEAVQKDNYTIVSNEIWEHIKIETNEWTAEFVTDVDIKFENKYNKRTIISTDNCMPDSEYTFNDKPEIKEDRIENNFKILIQNIYKILDKKYADIF